MTNAERQRKYRDKKRGGPPQGRWAGHTPAKVFAQAADSSRTGLFMAKWVTDHAPEFAPALHAGQLSLTPLYKRLKREYDLCVFRAVEAGLDADHLMIGRRGGAFEFSWRQSETRYPIVCVAKVNGYTPADDGKAVVYVARQSRVGWKKHPLYNPEPLPTNATDEERAACIAKYRDHVTALPDLRERLEELRAATRGGELPLGCWCRPKACHADVLAELLEALDR